MTDTKLLAETEQFLHQQIPITRAMGVRVETYDEEKLILSAPLEPNHNHLGTAFGGSLSAIATLAGYALLWLELGDREAHIVVRESSIDYHHPVRGEIRAIAKRPARAALAGFQAKYRKAGKARITLPVSIEHEQRECVSFTGVYVALASAHL